MPLDSTAERVPEPPTEEASEATLKKAPEGRPELRVVAPPEEATLEVSPAAQETFSDQTKETVAGLQPESKGFVGKLYEKIKSSEVVQNVVDRYQVWRNDKLAARAENKAGQLTQEQDGEKARFKSAEEAARRVEADFEKARLALGKMGRGISSETTEKVRQERDSHNQRAYAAEDQVQIIEGRIQDIRDKKEAYDTRVNEARGRLDGRLEAKQQINNEALSELGDKFSQLDSRLDQGRKSVDDLNRQAAELRGLLGTVNKSLQVEIIGHIKEIEEKQAKYAARIKELERARVDVDKKMKDLESKNVDLQAKRDKIFPPKEKPSVTEKSAEQPRFGTGDNEVSLEYGGGKEVVMRGDQIEEVGSDGKTTTWSADDAPEDVIAAFVTAGGRSLEEWQKEADAGRVGEKALRRIEALSTRQPETEKKPKFLAGDIVAAWNQEVGKGSGKQVTLEKSADPKKDLGSEVAAKDMLLTLLAKRLNRGDVKTLHSSTKGKVENFLAKRSAARR